jgi:sensor histidine kinase YesM
MNSMKHKWTFYLLWPNLAVAVVFLILIASRQLPSAREFFHALLYSLVYANLVAVFGVVLVEAFAKRWAHLKLSTLPAIALCIVVIIPVGLLIVQALLTGIGFLSPQDFWPRYFYNLRVSTPLAIVFGLGATIHTSLRERVQLAEEKLHEKEIAEERALKLATEARLRSLESRIHPHFLFNTLNSISSLIVTNPDRAERMVGQLAVLLRASLDNSNQQLIPLQQELGMVESYVDIERVRLGDKLRGSVDVPADLRAAKVPPMSVQSLVENAVKHGITPLRGGGEVCVSASANDGSVHIEVRDSGPGFDLGVVPAGHGLDNLVERLHALFGEKARINAFRRDGHSVVEMVLPRV